MLVAPSRAEVNTGIKGGAQELTTISNEGLAIKMSSRINYKSTSYLNWQKKLILHTKEHEMRQTLKHSPLCPLYSYFDGN